MDPAAHGGHRKVTEVTDIGDLGDVAVAALHTVAPERRIFSHAGALVILTTHTEPDPAERRRGPWSAFRLLKRLTAPTDIVRAMKLAWRTSGRVCVPEVSPLFLLVCPVDIPSHVLHSRPKCTVPVCTTAHARCMAYISPAWGVALAHTLL